MYWSLLTAQEANAINATSIDKNSRFIIIMIIISFLHQQRLLLTINVLALNNALWLQKKHE